MADEVLERLHAPFAALERLGVGRPAQLSLADYLAVLSAADLIAADAARSCLALYHQTRFGRRSVGEAELGELVRELEACTRRIAELPAEQRDSLAVRLRQRRDELSPRLPPGPKPISQPMPRAAVTTDRLLAAFVPAAAESLHNSTARTTRSRWFSRRSQRVLLGAGLVAWSLGLLTVGVWQQPRIEHLWRTSLYRLRHLRGPIKPTAQEMAKTRQLAEEYPDSANGWNRLAWQHWRRGEFADAIVAFHHALARSPDNAEIMNNLAWLLLTADEPIYRDPMQALPLAERAYKISQTPEITDTLAEAAYQNGDPDRAVALETEAIAKHPSNAATYAAQLKKFREAATKKAATAPLAVSREPATNPIGAPEPGMNDKPADKSDRR